MLDEHQVELVCLIWAVCDKRVGALDLALALYMTSKPFLYIAEFDRVVNRFRVFRRLFHGPIPAEVVIYPSYYFAFIRYIRIFDKNMDRQLYATNRFAL